MEEPRYKYLENKYSNVLVVLFVVTVYFLLYPVFSFIKNEKGDITDSKSFDKKTYRSTFIIGKKDTTFIGQNSFYLKFKNDRYFVMSSNNIVLSSKKEIIFKEEIIVRSKSSIEE